MSSSRVPLLCAFGVGCLCSAALFGFWRTDNHTDGSARVNPRARSAEFVTASLLPANLEQPRDTNDAAARASSTAPGDLARAETEVRNEPKDVPAAKEPPDAPPGGSAVSDVLTDLEAAYRQRLIAAARAEAEAARTPEPPSTPPPVSAAPVEPPPEVAAQVPAPPPAAPAPVAVAPQPVEPAPVAAPPPVPVAPVVVAQNDVRPPDIHIGDVNQNTYITNVRQGDVYVIQQQLAMMNYMQMLGNSAYPAHSHAPQMGRGSVQYPPPQSVPFKSTLTNLDNPWGFNFKNPYLLP